VTRKTKFKIFGWVILAGLIAKGCAPDRATWYGQEHQGKRMANGQPFDSNALTAASWDYPLGSRLKITHENKTVIVEVTDRGGEHRFLQFGKTIDLTRAAFSSLADPKAGSVKIKIVRVKKTE
jgi:rare lipoprotein A